MNLEANDRVLVVSPKTLDSIEDWAAILTHGVLVIVADAQAVNEGRKRFRDLENVMLVVEDQGVIPWQDRFFTKVLAHEDSPETRRVRAEAGSFHPLP